MSGKNNAHSEINASDVTIDVEASNVVDSGNLGDGITPEQQAQLDRQGLLNRQYREMENVISPEQQIAEAQLAEIEQRRAMVTEKLKELAAQQEIVKQKLQKPTTKVATTGAMVAALTTALGFAANKFGDAAGTAQKFVKETAQEVIKDNNFDVVDKVQKEFKSLKNQSIVDDAASYMAAGINSNVASLINKDGVVKAVEEVGKNLEQVNDKVRPTFLKKAGDIAGKIIGNKPEEINKAVEGGFLQGGFPVTGWGAKIPDGLVDVVDGAKTSVNEIATTRNNLLNGEHVDKLEAAFREKMPSFIVKPVDFYKSIPGGRAKDVCVIVGIGLLVAGIQHAMTSKELEERAQAEKEVNELSKVMTKGQERLLHLTRQGKEIKGKFSGAVVNETAGSRVLG